MREELQKQGRTEVCIPQSFIDSPDCLSIISVGLLMSAGIAGRREQSSPFSVRNTLRIRFAKKRLHRIDCLP